MKNFRIIRLCNSALSFKPFSIFVFLSAMLMFSCVKENQIDTSGVIIELRSGPGDWCDGGSTTPSPAAILSVLKDDPNCCITFRTLPNATVTINTTSFNFNIPPGSGSIPGGPVYTGTSDSNGLVTICFPEIGTHFQITVETSTYFGCDVFENQCD